MDVLTAAFTAAPRPVTITPTARGNCSRCAAADVPLAPTRHVVSKVFTAFEGWGNPSGAGLCPACTWAYRTPVLRMSAHLVTTQPRMVTLTPSRLRKVLQHPVEADAAVVVPLHPGRKHLLPAAQWGRIAVEDAALTWTGADADRLSSMHTLRSLGFGPRLLVAEAPQWQVLRRLPPAQRRRVQQEWPLLNTWRRSRLWFDLAVLASTPTAAAA